MVGPGIKGRRGVVQVVMGGANTCRGVPRECIVFVPQSEVGVENTNPDVTHRSLRRMADDPTCSHSGRLGSLPRPVLLDGPTVGGPPTPTSTERVVSAVTERPWWGSGSVF